MKVVNGSKPITEDELEEILRASLEGPWRLSLIVQLMVFAIVEVVIAAILRLPTLNLSPAAQLSYFTISLAFFFPLLVRTYHRVIRSISFGLYGAAIAVIAYDLVFYFRFDPNKMADIVLFLLILLIISVVLLRHVAVEFRVTRTTTVYIYVAFITAIFFALTLSFLLLIKVDIITSLMVTIVLTVIFGYAILPEHIV